MNKYRSHCTMQNHFEILRYKLFIWLYVLFVEALPSVLVGFLACFLLSKIPQAQEVLHGILGPAAPTYDKLSFQTAHQRFILPILAFFFSTLLLVSTIWYSGRLLVTVDATLHRPSNLIKGSMGPALNFAVEWVPRISSYLTCCFIVSSFISAQRIDHAAQSISLAKALWACNLPLIWFFIAKCAKPRFSLNVVGWIITFSMSVFLTITTSMDFEVTWINYLLCGAPFLPAIFLGIIYNRRTILSCLEQHEIQSAFSSIDFERVVIKLTIIVLFAGSALLLLAKSVSIARTIGSASTVLLFLSCLLGLTTTLLLTLRHLANGIPGSAWIGIIGIVLIAVIEDEPAGYESAPPAAINPTKWTMVEPSPVAQDVVINAYGGGLRAAVFTATVLADLDDRSCGQFGKRLNTLSGVSGGSLGIATYLTLRQAFVHSGGWKTCPNPKEKNFVPMMSMVANALLRDHLSPTLAHMLTTDLLPGSQAYRGQALLDSWQEGIIDALANEPLSAGQNFNGLAQAMTSLDGGLNPKPHVYFNTTNANTGKRVWFSNFGYWAEDNNPLFLKGGISVGQAVLHSARFPVVSPVGELTVGNRHLRLVDGGYADNSGTTTLEERADDPKIRFWININGNPPDDICSESPNLDPQSKIASSIGALLKVRESQAAISEDRLERDRPKWKKIDAILDFNAAFKNTMKDESNRCAFIQRMHSAPLGWYMTYDSYEPMKNSVFSVAATIRKTIRLPERF